jgi:hypothetical protein
MHAVLGESEVTERIERVKGVKRRLLSPARECPVGGISLHDLTWSDHLVKILNYSVIGIGIESERPIDPGMIWFKKNIYGQKCGFLMWCKQSDIVYRAGIQFISLTREEEEYIGKQIEQVPLVKCVPDPDRIIASVFTRIKRELGRIPGSFSGT